jgi:hypothetical protein
MCGDGRGWTAMIDKKLGGHICWNEDGMCGRYNLSVGCPWDKILQMYVWKTDKI